MESLTRDGVSLSFKDAGKGAPPVLLIHDLGRDHTSLRPQFEHFRRRHRVVAIDLLGHGRSDPLTRPYTLALFAEDLAWLCYELGVYRPVALGHGIGGMIAVELAVRYRDLLAAVVVLDAPARPEGRVEALATTGQVAAIGRDALAWDAAAVLAASDIPMLYVEASTSRADVDRLRERCPRIVVESLRLNDLHRREIAKQVNTAIDAFLLRSMSEDALGGRI